MVRSRQRERRWAPSSLYRVAEQYVVGAVEATRLTQRQLDRYVEHGRATGQRARADHHVQLVNQAVLEQTVPRCSAAESEDVATPLSKLVNGIDGLRADIVMMRTPDGNGRLELTKIRSPELVPMEPAQAPPNALGLRSIMFAVEDLDDTIARISTLGTEVWLVWTPGT